MLTVAAGAPLVGLIRLCFSARLPLLLHGKHGVGKSEIFAYAASELGIGLIERDLSLMEPGDLLGLPHIDQDSRTRYASPSFLPTDGKGLLLLEEVNRSPRFMQAPCLQLLTARRLNEFELPSGWLPCATVNDAADGYVVDELDEALLARFVRARVEPDVGEWLKWARQHGVHERIVTFVDDSPGIFDDPGANPRAWKYASDLLTQWERGDQNGDLLAIALSGVLSERWAAAFLRTYSGERRPLQPVEIIESYPAFQACVRQWIESGHLDAVAASVELLKRYIQPQPTHDALLVVAEQRANVECFIRDLPGDLRRELADWLGERGFKRLAAAARSRRTSA